MNSFTGKDDCTATILDFIAGGVPGNPNGESAGNYNAVIGEVARHDDLSKYTLAFVRYSLMSKLLEAGRPSTAVGRYQIIRSTLIRLQASMALHDEVMFTPAIQDAMAVKLLIGRGYPSWWRGSVGNTEFMHNLSCEWASLPDPYNGGKSHYDRVGNNHAGTTVVAFNDVLNRASAMRPHA